MAVAGFVVGWRIHNVIGSALLGSVCCCSPTPSRGSWPGTGGQPRGLEFAAGGEGLGLGVAPSWQGAPIRVDGGFTSFGEPVHTVLHGRVADKVSRVVVIRDDGIEVEAAVENGHFFAWWPTTDEPRTARAYKEDGSLVADWHRDRGLGR